MSKPQLTELGAFLFLLTLLLFIIFKCLFLQRFSFKNQAFVGKQKMELVEPQQKLYSVTYKFNRLRLPEMQKLIPLFLEQFIFFFLFSARCDYLSFLIYIFNMSHPKPSPLWHPSPCTLGFPNHISTFQQSERFKLFSIYSRDDVNKQKKVFSLIEKPELLVAQFRRQIEEAGSNKWKRKLEKEARNRKRHCMSQAAIYQSTQKTKESMATTITNRLYRKTTKLQLKHDYFGNRSHFQDKQDEGNIFIKDLSQHSLAKSQIKAATPVKVLHYRKPYIFSQSKRLDLSKPLNFFPGPGSYPSQQPKKQVTFSKWRSQQNFAKRRMKTQ